MLHWAFVAQVAFQALILTLNYRAFLDGCLFVQLAICIETLQIQERVVGKSLPCALILLVSAR